MVESIVDKKAETIEIKANSKREFFLLHGYTGSPTDFNKLGGYLNKRFNANVKIIRLKGHGEKIENLDNLRYKDFLLQAGEELKKDLLKGREIIIGGISLGGFIAMQLSVKYPVKGILCISPIYKYKFPFGIIAFLEPLIFKKTWKKQMTQEEMKMRKKAFYYDASIKGLKIVNQAKKEVESVWNKITSPCLLVYPEGDKIFHEKNLEIIQKSISSKISETYTITDDCKVSHNPFYSSNHEKLYKIIGDFVKRNNLFKKV